LTGREASVSPLGSEVEVRFGDGAELRGESVVSDMDPVLHPSLPDRAVWEEDGAEGVSAARGCPEGVGAVCMVFTGLRTHRLT